MRRLPTFVSILVVALGGCGDPTALNVAARTAQAVACTVCGTAEPDVREQAAALSRSIAELTEAIAVLAAQKDAEGAAAALAALKVRQEEQRKDFERLVMIASLPIVPSATASAAPVAAPPAAPSATPAPTSSAAPGAP